MDHTTAQTMLGRYRLLRKIGKGGMGDVWLAEDPLLRRQVALKTLPRQHRDDGEYLQRFEREARAAAALHHPHILPVHDYGTHRLPNGDTIAYIVMSYVSGGSIEDQLKRLKNEKTLLPPVEAFHYLSQAAEAIDYAHEQGIIHRDIKPANMLLREDNWVLLTDFGLARLLSESNRLTQTGEGFGTPDYIAPEQAQGRAVASSDIYSLAVIAYEFFTGRVPFSAESSYGTIIQHIINPPPPPRQFNPALPVSLEQVLLQALAKDPAQRPPSGAAFIGELRKAMSAIVSERTFHMPNPSATNTMTFQDPSRLPTREIVPPSPPVEEKPDLSRRKVLIGAGAGILAIGGGIAAFSFTPLGHAFQGIQPTPGTTQRPSSSATARPSADAPTISLENKLVKPAQQLTWSPTADTLTGVGEDGTIVYWNIEAGNKNEPETNIAKLKLSTSVGGGFLGLAWSKDGSMLVLSYNGSLTTAGVYKNDFSTLAPGFTKDTITTNPGGIVSLCWGPGKYIFLVEHIPGNIKQALLRTIDPTQPQSKLQSLKIDVAYRILGISSVAISPTNTNMLAIGAPEGALVGPISVSGTQVKWEPDQFKLGSRVEVTQIAWSPDGNFLATLTNNTTIRNAILLWDIKQRSQSRTAPDLAALQAKPTCIAWSPAVTNPLLAIGSNEGTILLWDSRSAKMVRTIAALENKVVALAWSRNGQWLAASFNDTSNSILVWRIDASHG
jgi:serine/threonine protein kinase